MGVSNKVSSDGSIDHHKARLVAQGFSQIPSFNFTHTFSHVVKASTVRIILSFAVMRSWPHHQINVKNVFLNGYLSKPVYMFESFGRPYMAFARHR